MNIEETQIQVGPIRVDVIRKDIKNLHVGVYPPDGRVRVAAPASLGDEAVRLAVVTRMSWIKRQRARFENQPRQSERNYVSGESHYLLGRSYRLNVIEGVRRGEITLKNSRTLNLHLRSGSTDATRAKLFANWYRQELRHKAAPLIKKWAVEFCVEPPDWRIKRMKTKWGSCNIEDRRIWLNLELAKKPVECIEYVIVHEFVHFFERRHSDRFVALMEQMLPKWRLHRDILNSQPLAHEEWNADLIHAGN